MNKMNDLLNRARTSTGTDKEYGYHNPSNAAVRVIPAKDAGGQLRILILRSNGTLQTLYGNGDEYQMLGASSLKAIVDMYTDNIKVINPDELLKG